VRRTFPAENRLRSVSTEIWGIVHALFGEKADAALSLLTFHK
jgi:hypothetical protein